jgi:putative FmdB family regulatory protein
MPIYEYVCKDCTNEFESLRAMSQADAVIACEACGRENTRRIPSVCYSESGGKALAGSSSPSCGSCPGGNCGGCGH